MGTLESKTAGKTVRVNPRFPESTATFIEFLLTALLTALREAAGTDQVGDQVTDQVAALL